MRIALFASALALLLVLLISYVSFRLTFFSVRKKHIPLYYGLDGELTERKKGSREAIDRLSNKRFESVSIRSFDGKLLRGKYYHISDKAPTVIALHGYKSRGLRDMARISYEFELLGYNLLLADQRSHADSEGKVISFGAREKYDVKSWTEYINSRFKNPKIFLFGISMGAATVLMSASLPMKNVFGIIADCPYSTPKKIIMHVCKALKLVPVLIYPFIRIGGMLFGGFDVSAHSSISGVLESSIRVLLIHGEGDNFVPCHMSEEIYESARFAGKDITLLKIPDATHGLAIAYDRNAYIDAVKKFIDKSILEGETEK